MRYIVLTIFASMLLMASAARAQNLQMLGDDSGQVSVTATPSRPGPNQIVTVVVESYAVDLDRSAISWFLNNTLAGEATGKKTFTFKTGKPGFVSNILIVIKPPNGPPIQQVLNIHPATVDLVWEAQSYTPPFYKGKALYPYQGTVKVVALPNIVTENGGTLNPKTLVYDWRVNNSPARNASGYGKNFIFFNGSVPLKPANISVEVSSVDQTYSAESSTILAPAQPGIIFYEDDPLLGTLYNRALPSTIALKNPEIKLAAVPYFFEGGARETGGFKYSWQLAGDVVKGSSGKSSLAFERQTGATGSAPVSLQVSNPAKIFQYAEASLTLYWNNPTAKQL